MKSFQNWLEIAGDFTSPPERPSARSSQSSLSKLQPKQSKQPEISSEVTPTYDDFIGNLQKLLDIMDWNRKDAVAIKQTLNKVTQLGNLYLSEL